MEDQIGEVAELFRRFRHVSHLCMDREFARSEMIKVSNPKVLFMLKHKEHQGPVTQKQLADWIGVAPPTVAVSIKRMEKAGLVKKTVNQDDLRENYIELTDYGHQMTDKSEEIVRTLYGNIFEDFSPGELETLLEYISRIIAKMEELGGISPKDE